MDEKILSVQFCRLHKMCWKANVLCRNQYLFFNAPCYCILLDISFQISARLTVPAENTITENSEDSERATILYQFYISKKQQQQKTSDLYIFKIDMFLRAN